MSTLPDDEEFKAAHKKAMDAMSSLDETDVRLADYLEEYADFLRSRKLKLLDAANLEARAKAIRAKSGVKQCPFCAETIKAEALLCMFQNYLSQKL